MIHNRLRINDEKLAQTYKPTKEKSGSLTNTHFKVEKEMKIPQEKQADRAG